MTYQLIQSKHFTKGRNKVVPRLIVIHTMETPETEGRAKQVADWFASNFSPEASAHYCVDNKHVYNTVLEADTSWAVDDFFFNEASISIELAGQASQDPKLWYDAYSKSELDIAAKLVADISKRHKIPLVKLTPAEINAGKSGICSHLDITVAKHIAGGHSDPGKDFPWTEFVSLAKKYHG